MQDTFQSHSILSSDLQPHPKKRTADLGEEVRLRRLLRGVRLDVAERGREAEGREVLLPARHARGNRHNLGKHRESV